MKKRLILAQFSRTIFSRSSGANRLCGLHVDDGAERALIGQPRPRSSWREIPSSRTCFRGRNGGGSPVTQAACPCNCRELSFPSTRPQNSSAASRIAGKRFPCWRADVRAVGSMRCSPTRGATDATGRPRPGTGERGPPTVGMVRCTPPGQSATAALFADHANDAIRPYARWFHQGCSRISTSAPTPARRASSASAFRQPSRKDASGSIGSGSRRRLGDGLSSQNATLRASPHPHPTTTCPQRTTQERLIALLQITQQ